VIAVELTDVDAELHEQVEVARDVGEALALVVILEPAEPHTLLNCVS
jgi:hypothetical protein